MMRWSLLLLWVLNACVAEVPSNFGEPEAPQPPGELLRRGDVIATARHPIEAGFHREESYAIYRQGELCGMRFCTMDAVGSDNKQTLHIEERMAIFTKGSWQISRAKWNLGHDWKPEDFKLSTRTTQIWGPPVVRTFQMHRDATGYNLSMAKDGKDFSAHIKDPGMWFCSTPELMIPWLPASDKPYSLRTLLFESGDLVEVAVIPRSIEHRDGISYHVLEMRVPGQSKGEILTVASSPTGVLMGRTLLASKAHLKLVTPDRISVLRQSFHLPEWPEFR